MVDIVIEPIQPEEQVYISEVKSDEIISQLCKYENDTLYEISEAISVHLNKNGPGSTDFQVGQYVATSVEGVYCRARIMDREGEHFSVESLDWGGRTKKTADELVALPDELCTKWPQIAIRVVLKEKARAEASFEADLFEVELVEVDGLKKLYGKLKPIPDLTENAIEVNATIESQIRQIQANKPASPVSVMSVDKMNRVNNDMTTRSEITGTAEAAERSALLTTTEAERETVPTASGNVPNTVQASIEANPASTQAADVTNPDAALAAAAIVEENPDKSSVEMTGIKTTPNADAAAPPETDAGPAARAVVGVSPDTSPAAISQVETTSDTAQATVTTADLTDSAASPKAGEIPPTKPEPTESVVIVYDNGNRLYGAQLTRLNLTELEGEIAGLYEASRTVKLNPKEGEYVVAAYDSFFCRAQICKVETSTVRIVFIDYGQISHVNHDQIFELQGELTVSEPWRAICIKPKDENITLEGELEVRIVGSSDQSDTIFYEVEPLTSIIENENELKAKLTRGNLIPCDVSEETETLYVTEKKDDCVAVQRGKYTIDDLLNINATLTEYIQNAEPAEVSQTFEVDDLVAFDIDGNFYRGLVTAIDADKYTIYQLDFGSYTTVSGTDLRPFPAEFLTYPPIGMLCKLREGQSELIGDAEEFAACKFERIPSDEINDLFYFEFVPKDTPELQQEKPNEIPTQEGNVDQPIEVTDVCFDVSSTESVQVTFIDENFSNMGFQLRRYDQVGTIDKINADLKEYFQQKPSAEPVDVKVGDFVAVVDDDVYYRAVVHSKAGGFSIVQCIDYGSLHYMSEKLLRLPKAFGEHPRCGFLLEKPNFTADYGEFLMMDLKVTNGKLVATKKKTEASAGDDIPVSETILSTPIAQQVSEVPGAKAKVEHTVAVSAQPDIEVTSAKAEVEHTVPACAQPGAQPPFVHQVAAAVIAEEKIPDPNQVPIITTAASVTIPAGHRTPKSARVLPGADKVFEVVVTHLCAATKVCVVRLSDVDAAQGVSLSLTNLHSTSQLTRAASDRLNIGSEAAVDIGVDQKTIHRARIIRYDYRTKLYNVFLLDSGEVTDIGSDSFWELPKSFAIENLPGFAMVVKLHADDNADIFHNGTSAIPAYVGVLQCSVEDSYIDEQIPKQRCHRCKLFNKFGDIVEQLIARGSARPWSPRFLKNPLLIPCGTGLGYLDAELSSIKTVDGITSITLSLAELNDQIGKLMNRLELSELCPLYALNSGAPGVAYFQNPSPHFKRARVLDRPTPGEYKLYLVDSGIEVNHPVRRTYKCPTDALHLAEAACTFIAKPVAAGSIDEHQIVVVRADWQLETGFTKQPTIKVYDHSGTLLYN